jgi:hypothetical protein
LKIAQHRTSRVIEHRDADAVVVKRAVTVAKIYKEIATDSVASLNGRNIVKNAVSVDVRNRTTALHHVEAWKCGQATFAVSQIDAASAGDTAGVPADRCIQISVSVEICRQCNSGR